MEMNKVNCFYNLYILIFKRCYVQDLWKNVRCEEWWEVRVYQFYEKLGILFYCRFQFKEILIFRIIWQVQVIYLFNMVNYEVVVD